MIESKISTIVEVQIAAHNSIAVYRDGYSLINANASDAITIYKGATILAILYGTSLFPGVMQLSAILTEDIYKYPVSFIKFIRKLLEQQNKKSGIHRLQFEVKASYIAGQKFAESLGFVKEGIMRKFGSDQSDYILYARVI